MISYYYDYQGFLKISKSILTPTLSMCCRRWWLLLQLSEMKMAPYWQYTYELWIRMAVEELAAARPVIIVKYDGMPLLVIWENKDNTIWTWEAEWQMWQILRLQSSTFSDVAYSYVQSVIVVIYSLCKSTGKCKIVINNKMSVMKGVCISNICYSGKKQSQCYSEMDYKSIFSDNRMWTFSDNQEQGTLA